MRTELILVAIICLAIVVLSWQLSRRTQKQLSKKYRLIYRVVSIPPDSQCVLKAECASIEIGDYGWEAEPIFRNDLIYLHGLNDQWQVVWYAGFRPDQLEVVGQKPRSQYYIFPDWKKTNIPQCPFPAKSYRPVKIYLKTHFGYPKKIHGNWVQGKQIAA